MSSYLTGWRLALRLARRDLLKHRTRAVIALVMVTLPVLAVITADVLIQTADVSPTEGISRRLGSVATAELRITDDQTEVVQSADPQAGWGESEERLPSPTTVADIEGVIGHRSMLVAPDLAEVVVRTPHGREAVDAEQVDPAAPLASGLYRLVDGHWPTTKDEVVVNQALRDRGVGDTLTVVGPDRTETTRTIVGTIVHPTHRSQEVVVGLPGSLPVASNDAAGQGWLVDGRPITWGQVEQLNKLGVLVTDRHIASHTGDYPDPLAYSSGVGNTTAQIAALIIVMSLIEVVLLAGPAFAVGARKQQRSLALLVASGGTPAQSRRVIIAGGVLLGVTAAVVGIAGGIGAAWLLRPVGQRFSADWLGPFDVPWPHLLAVAAFGLVSALLSCLVPAWIASRQNVVAVLAGRRGDAKPVRAFPFLGVALFAVGVLMAVAGARGHGDFTVAWSAVVCVLGMVLLVPVVVSWTARVAGRFPLPVRFAARDAVRHRTRTTPAVAAIAATVAGVVALGIAISSDEKERREDYTPDLAMGNAAVTPSSDPLDPSADLPADWDRVAGVVREHVPGASITPVVGVELVHSETSWADLAFVAPGAGVDDGWIGPASSNSATGTDIFVSDGTQLPAEVDAFAARASQALAAGRAFVLTSDPSQAELDHVSIVQQTTDDQGGTSTSHELTVPATVTYVSADETAPVRAILPPDVVERAGLHTQTFSLDVAGADVSRADEKDLEAALEDLPTPASVYVERGYQTDAEVLILQWVLVALGAILMLGGTLTASFLALADARPDLATLAAVGAEPRTRRFVGAAYTFVVGFVGAVLGMLVGFVPGLAITWPLTSAGDGGAPGPSIDVPWLMIAAVVLGLPVLTALIVGLFTRSRLPMVSRLT